MPTVPSRWSLKLSKSMPVKLGIWGKGMGAIMGLFTAKFTDKIVSQVLQYPSFCYIDIISKSNSLYANEIKRVLKNKTPREKEKIKANLAYFDGLYLAENLATPSVLISDLENRAALPEQAFSIFNHLQGEKEMHLFAETGLSEIEQERKVGNTVRKYFEKTL